MAGSYDVDVQLFPEAAGKKELFQEQNAGWPAVDGPESKNALYCAAVTSYASMHIVPPPTFGMLTIPRPQTWQVVEQPCAGDGLFREAERTALRLELVAAELEPMLSAETESDSAECKRLLLVERRAQLARAFGAVLARRFELVGVVSRASEAIERLSRVGADVIAVGEQLGGEMTGPQLLAFVRVHWPSVLRVLQAEGEPPPAGVADAVLWRPVSPLDLVAAVERLS